jgi:uncharacterized ubiquitin-like protein YukD
MRAMTTDERKREREREREILIKYNQARVNNCQQMLSGERKLIDYREGKITKFHIGKN